MSGFYANAGPPEGLAPPPPMVLSNSPARSRSILGSAQRAGPLMVAPTPDRVRDWEGFTQQAVARQVENEQRLLRGTGTPNRLMGGAGPSPAVVNARSPSVGVLAAANERAQAMLHPSPRTAGGLNRSGGPQSLSRALAAAGAVAVSPGSPAAGGLSATNGFMDHATYNQWRREQFEKRLDAEARGERFMAERPFSQEFYNATAAAANGGPSSLQQALGGFVNIDFTGRTARDLPVQVMATKDEMSWLHPPPIPPPVGWNGYWDLCAGHELVLQHMAVSGANPENSPSLTQHFMYPELLSCVQRLQYGTYMVSYTKGEPPHERYFYLKSLPLANRAQYCPFFCWSLHRHAHNALDCIPLVNVMWVTAGPLTAAFQKYLVGGDYIRGPFVGKRPAECLVHGAFSVWVYDGYRMRTVDILAPDPLVFTMWMKLLEDAAQLNAALDLTGHIKSLQRQIENSREDGSIAGLAESSRPAGEGLFSYLYGGKRANPMVRE